MAMARPARTRSLARLVQSLPQEIYDEIYVLTFTADSNKVVNLETERAFPSLLHVDHRSRESFARSYYANTTFTLWYDVPGDITFFDRWLGRLSEEHLHLVSSLLIKVGMRVLAASNRTAYIYEQKVKALEAMNVFVGGVLRDWAAPPADAVRIQMWPGWQESITTESFGDFRQRVFRQRVQAPPMLQEMRTYALNLRATLAGKSV